ncbi:MAG: dUTP diphosphatase [Thermoleophilia bacterium]|nr:dUTP diphosphatase [Thermoleophilia bacterium]
MSEIGWQRLHEAARLPERVHANDAGFDLYATEPAMLGPGERQAVGCGFAIALPDDMAALVLPRSGLALQSGLTVLNAPGLIDAGYRGEIKVILINHDPTAAHTVAVGDRIAQLVITSLPAAVFAEHADLPDSTRGTGGFGSTGQSA